MDEAPPPPPPPQAVKIQIEPEKKKEIVLKSHKHHIACFKKGLIQEGWKYEKPKAGGALTSSGLKLVTWNVFFGNVMKLQRYEKIMQESLSKSPDIICFQEVTDDFIKVLKENPQIRNDFLIVPGDEKMYVPKHNWYGVTICVRKTFGKPVLVEETEVPTRMGRAWLSVVFQRKGETLAVSTIHAESLSSAGTRKQQFETIGKYGEKYDQHIICGDFNISGGMESKNIPSVFEDCWLESNNGEETLTWNHQSNPTIHASNPSDNWMARCDRVMLAGAKSGKKYEMSLIGTEKTVEGKYCPSDHFGLFFDAEEL